RRLAYRTTNRCARRSPGSASPAPDGAAARVRYGRARRLAQSPGSLCRFRCRRRPQAGQGGPSVRNERDGRGRGRRRHRRRSNEGAHMSDPAVPAADSGIAQDQANLLASLKLARRVEAVPLVVALVMVVIVFQLINGLFLNPRNLVNLLTELAPLEFIAIASTVMIIMGEIDLSLGSLAGFSGALLASSLASEAVPWPVAVGLAF